MMSIDHTTPPPPDRFIKCCGIHASHEFVRRHWRYIGTQCMQGNGPCLALFDCPLCRSTRAIEVECGKHEVPL